MSAGAVPRREYGHETRAGSSSDEDSDPEAAVLAQTTLDPVTGEPMLAHHASVTSLLARDPHVKEPALDETAKRVLLKQKSVAETTPMSAMLDMVAITRLKRWGRKRRVRRLRAVAPSQHEADLQQYLQECVARRHRSCQHLMLLLTPSWFVQV